MTLKAGTRLGPYEVEAPLGHGGMGEVYRARDTRLNREVAVKVLPAHLAESPELRQRFEREAKAISQLTHPHICTLYDVGHDVKEGLEYLVMELVDGESLAERLTRGALPADQVVRFGIEIADALEAAHKHGIVHRDLKPGNVMLTKSGVKLLDFGLAKHRAAAAQGEIEALTSLATEMSPSQPLTAQGTIMGTFQYMAPEQLEGADTDERGDIFAFGCVLYEMATGKPAFTGKSRASLIAAILERKPPPISSIVPMTPPALDRLVATCLAKDPEDRFQTAHDVKLELQWIAEGGSQVGAPAIVSARRKSRERLAWAIAALTTVAAVALGAGFALRTPKPQTPVRFDFVLPKGMSLVQAPRISPDGKNLAFSAAGKDGKSRIWIRPLEALKPRPVPGTEGATLRPFWAPDSKHLGFMAGGKLKKVDIAGDPPQTICNAPTGADGSWGKDGVILFDGQVADPIRRVPASGGVPQTAVSGEHGRLVGWPYFLPDGRHFLYFEFGGGKSENDLMVGSLDPKEKPRKLLDCDSLAAYAPGYLLYVKDQTLVAQPFDVSSLEITGEPVPLAEQMGAVQNGLADFSVSDNGVLVYRTGASSDSRLVWLDRTGKELSDVGKPALYDGPSALSPDGTQLAFTIQDPRTRKDDIWVRDLERGVTSRLTFDPGNNGVPMWSPDGRLIVFTSDRNGTLSLFEKNAAGTGPTKELWSCGDPIIPNDWSRDGRFIAVDRITKDGKMEIWIYPTDGKSKPFAFIAGKFWETSPVFSPNDKYVAYVSNESGRSEIYVRQFPGPGGKWQISTNGGAKPYWSTDGKTLYFESLNSKIMATSITKGATFSAGVPHPLFSSQLQPQLQNSVLVARNGKKFLVLSPLEKKQSTSMVVILHWPQTLNN